jgi:hypothetical protein
MSLVAEILLVWLVGIPASIVAYASLGRRWYERRMARRRAALSQPAPVVSIRAARGLSVRGTRPAQRKATLSA